jgi:superoxide dismutase
MKTKSSEKEGTMPWDELKPRQFPAFDKELDGISKQTMEDHYKLYEGYAKKANQCRRILNEFDYSQIEGNQVYSELRAVSIDYTFALLGYKNHDLYFGHLGGEGGEPTGRFAELIDEEFNGVDQVAGRRQEGRQCGTRLGDGRIRPERWVAVQLHHGHPEPLGRLQHVPGPRDRCL